MIQNEIQARLAKQIEDQVEMLENARRKKEAAGVYFLADLYSLTCVSDVATILLRDAFTSSAVCIPWVLPLSKFPAAFMHLQ